MRDREKNSGITLIALVVTIIVLLILAGISLAMLTGPNGLINKAQSAKEETEIGQVREKIRLAVTNAATNGLGKILYNRLDEEMKKQFGEGNYEIRATEVDEEWKVVAYTSNRKEVSEIVTTTGIVNNVATGIIQGTGIALKYEVVPKGAYSIIKLYPVIESSNTYGDYATNIIYGKNEKELEELLVEGVNYRRGERKEPYYNNIQELIQYWNNEGWNDATNFEELGQNNKEHYYSNTIEMMIRNEYIKPKQYYNKYYNYAFNIINGKSKEEIEEIFVEGINYWNSMDEECEEPYYNNIQELIEFWNNEGWTEATNLEEMAIEEDYDSVIELMIGWQLIKPENFDFDDWGEEEISKMYSIKCRDKYIIESESTDMPYAEYKIYESGKYEFTLESGGKSVSGEIEVTLNNPNANKKIIEVFGKGVGLTDDGKVVSLVVADPTWDEDDNIYDPWVEVIVKEEFSYINGVKSFYSGTYDYAEYYYIIDNNGDVYAWGTNSYGLLGVGSTKNSIDKPTKVKGISDIEEIYTHSYNEPIFKDKNGNIYECERSGAVKINGVSKVKDVYLSNYNTIAQTESGELYSWGSNGYGQVGIGSTEGYISEPTKIEGVSNVKYVKIWGSYGYGMIALTETGDVYVWGNNKDKKLGIESTETKIREPVKIEELNNIDDIYVKSNCCENEGVMIARTKNGEVYIYSEKIEEFSNIVDIYTDGDSIIAKNGSGELYAWGKNNHGQLGIGSTETFINTPTKVGMLNNIKDVCISKMYYEEHAIALTESGEVYVWGKNEGQLGIESAEEYIRSPIKIEGLNNITDVWGEYASMMARTETGEIYVWGVNSDGLLGIGNEENQITPVKLNAVESSRIYGKDIDKIYNILDTNTWKYIITIEGKCYASYTKEEM